MFAPRNRGNLSVHPSFTARRPAGRIAGRGALRSAAMVAVAGLLAATAGCDNATNAANKQVRAAVAAAESPKRSIASDASVSGALSGGGAGVGQVPNVEKVAESLRTLAEVNSRAPGDGGTASLAAWKTEEAKLSVRQRQGLSAALRSAALADLEAARKQMQAAVDTAKAGSPEAAIDPLLRLSDLELASGDLLAQDASDRDVEAAVLVADVHRLLGQLRLSATDLDVLAAGAPTASLQALDAIKAKIAGADASADWIGTGDTALPAISKVKAKVDEAEAELKRLTGEKTDAEENVKKLQGEAAKTRAEADSATGDIGMNLGKEAAAKSEQAAQLLIKIEDVQGKIDAKQHELDVLKTREPGAVKAQEIVDKRKQSLSDRWLSAREVLRSMATDIGSLIGSPAAAGTVAPAADDATGSASKPADPAKALEAIRKGNDISAKLARIKAAVEDAERIRGLAGDQFQSALGHADDAGKNAAQTATALKGGTGLDAHADLMEPGQFQVRQAIAHLRLAGLAADAVVNLAARADLRAQADASFAVAQASVKKADELLSQAGSADKNLSWEPDTLTKLAKLDAPLTAVTELPTRNKDLVASGEKDALGRAKNQFDLAEGLLKQVLGETDEASIGETNEATTQELATVAGQSKRAALGVRANVSYARSKLLSLVGDTAGAQALAKAAVDQAKQYRGKYRQELPAGSPLEIQEKLGITPASKPSIKVDGAPATAPAAAGTPAVGAAPVTPPTTPAPAAEGSGFLAPTPTAPAPTAPTPAVPTPAAPSTPPAEGATPAAPTVPATPPAEGAAPTAPPATPPAPGGV